MEEISFKMNCDLDIEPNEYIELELQIDIIDYSPYRPAPNCHNPSNPNFSDPGDDLEIEYEATIISVSPNSYDFILNDNKTTRLEEGSLPDEMYKLLDDQIITQCIKQLESYEENKYIDAMEAKYEAQKDREAFEDERYLNHF